MEDTKHFIAQNGLNGAVFIAFAVGCWVLFQPETVLLFAKSLMALQNASAVLSFLFAAILTPIVGYAVQAISLIPYYLGGGPYRDESRRMIADLVRDRVNIHPNINEKTKVTLRKIADDSIFVAIYYKEAPQYLIEWARRRRDTQHLGDNWAAAAVLGVFFAFLAMIIFGFSEPLRGYIIKFVGVVLLVLWVAGLHFMRRKMKDEADGMETVWALIHLHPEVASVAPGPGASEASTSTSVA